MRQHRFNLNLKYLVIFLLFGGVVMGYPREILVDDGGPPPSKPEALLIDEANYIEEGDSCHMEYQVSI